jgi:hypothetical protein
MQRGPIASAPRGEYNHSVVSEQERVTMSRYALILSVVLGVAPAPVVGQTLQQRIDGLRTAAPAADDPMREMRVHQRNTANRLRDAVEGVQIENAPVRQAFEWWSRNTGVALIINWEAMELDGIDPDTPIDLRLGRVQAGVLLELLLKATVAGAAGEVGLVYEVEPGFIQVMTKRQAVRQPVTMVYDITDLLMEIPHFDNAPSFDLSESLAAGGQRGGRGGGGGGGLFGDTADREREVTRTRTERAEEIAQLIRDTIEPTIWMEAGGEYGSIRYFRNMLVIRAPKFVHRQIGVPIRTPALPAIGGQVGGDSPL